MKKTQKQEMLETVQTLHQAHEEIKINIERKNFMFAQDMLSQCQECAVSIGNAIEKLEGEGFVTVHFIEAYCDILFSVFEELNGTEANANKIYKNLKKQLLRIENSIKNDVPIRKEIAFFPYKASMWDSLESVYLKLKEDTNCDVYCVPIPYYDRNADGSLGQMHYEGREYPKNIEVIDWQTYNFEERKPDVIYIHNPYDDWNLVTCVHPRFFSANLKKSTEELVYIPYFVLPEIEPDDQNQIDAMKHFIWTPGVINADKVIVQSEEMKQIYVNEYLKAAQANRLPGKHTDRKYLEEKIQGLGSPKLEKVKNTKKENLEMPPEWLKIIEKPDGSWKKIVFYNTSIAALLENNEKMLKKMKNVFQLFKENQDDIALLWRPHPLIKSTVASMRPQLWAEYEKIVNQYRQEGWGIYDDTSDVDRAIVLSDAYYGDASSVVQVYQQTGKPVLVQNVVVNKKTDNTSYLLNSWCKDENNSYFVPHNLNILVKYSEEKQRSEWIRLIAKAGQEKFALYSDIKKYKQKLFLIPLHDTKIVTYDIERETFEYIPIPHSKHWDCAWGNFSKAYEYGENLYLIGYQYPGIVRLNMETLDCEQVLNIYEICKQYKGQLKLSLESIENNEKIYILIHNTDELIRYEMRTGNNTVYHLKNNAMGKYQTIAFDGEKFWFTSNGKEYLIWDEEKQDGKIFVHPKQEKIPKDSLYRYSFYNHGKLYAISSKEAPIVVVDCKEFNQSRLIWKDEEREKGFRADYLFKYENVCAFIDLENQVNRVINSQTDKIEEVKRAKDRSELVQTLHVGNESTVIKEGGISLLEFIEML